MVQPDTFDEPEAAEEPASPPAGGGLLDSLQDQFGSAPWWATSAVVHVGLVLLTMLLVINVKLPLPDDVIIATDITRERPARPPQQRITFQTTVREVQLPEIVEHPVFVHEQVDDLTHMETENDLESRTARGQEDAISDVPLGGQGVVGTMGIGGGGGGAFGTRTGGGRHRAALRAGGSPGSESAVDAALAWLARHQEPDGHWDGRKYGGMENDVGLTGLALLAFLSAGHTETLGEYKENVVRGVGWLISQQSANGAVFGKQTGQRGYHHSLAGLALAEAYGMSQLPRTRAAAQRALDYSIREHASPDGGWRYDPREAADTSVTGWFVMQLKSARIAGLAVDDAAFAGALKFLGTVTMEDGQCRYRPDSGPRRTMTAVGVVIRLFCGAPRTDKSVVGAGGFLQERAPAWGPANVNFYYWYYGTLGMFQLGGGGWETWNEHMRDMLLENQRKDKPPSNAPDDTHGSWDYDLDEYGNEGGRVYTTAMGCLCLEVYYRYLPLYGGKASNPAPF